MKRCVKSASTAKASRMASFSISHEAHAIDEAVILILVTLQIFEGCTLLFSACPVDARELPAEESFAGLHRTRGSWAVSFDRMRVMVSETT